MNASEPSRTASPETTPGGTIQSQARAFRQKSNEVFVRTPGERLLSGPFEAACYAREHWQFAHLANAAYQDTPAANVARVQGKTAQSLDSNGILQQHGWAQWEEERLSQIDLAEFAEYHLRVEVWRHVASKKVVVCFGGTVFKNLNDWRANLRWFLPKKEDEYSETVRTFAPAFAAAFQKEYGVNSDVTVYATGHSLGGGLAQQFAYCLPNVPSLKKSHITGPKIKAVYAFDPSPVTGFYSVPAAERKKNVVDLFIDRVYERGEVLAALRAITSLFYPPSSINPEVRGVRYSLFYSKGFDPAQPITGHSIVDLAIGLQEKAGEGRPTLT
jgi:pimeloyl-ACP methyl ester carboxylesterase